MFLFLHCIYYFLLILTIFSIPMGIYSLSETYYVTVDNIYIPKEQIKKIDSIDIDNDLVQLFPEYFSRDKENLWWSQHKKLYDLLSTHEKINGILEKGGQRLSVQLSIHKFSWKDAIRKVIIIYVCVFVYLITALLLKERHLKTQFGLPATIFLLASSLYLSTAAPLAGRQLTLEPQIFKIIIWMNYISGGLIISLVHFSFVFPWKKMFIYKYPFIPWILYLYVLIVTILYISGISAFDTSLPCFFIWSVILFWAFIDTLINETDPFIKKQIYLVLFAPLFLSIIFLALHIIPLAIGREAIDFTSFSIFSLILPFALPLAIDNVQLQIDKSQIEKILQEELEKVQNELHDFILRKFSFISVASQNLLRLISRRQKSNVIRGIEQIHREATHVSHDLRFFLNLINSECTTWSDYVANIRYYANKILAPFNISVFVEARQDLLNESIPSLMVQSTFFWILSEALANVVIHSGATKVKISITCNEGLTVFKIIDNGAGFSKDEIEYGHMGFIKIKKYANRINANVRILSKVNWGTAIFVQIQKS